MFIGKTQVRLASRTTSCLTLWLLLCVPVHLAPRDDEKGKRRWPRTVYLIHISWMSVSQTVTFVPLDTLQFICVSFKDISKQGLPHAVPNPSLCLVISPPSGQPQVMVLRSNDWLSKTWQDLPFLNGNSKSIYTPSAKKKASQERICMHLKHFKCTVNSHTFKCGQMNILSLINLVSNSSFLREKKGFGIRWVEWQMYFLFYIWIESKKRGFLSRSARTQFKPQKSEDRGYFEPTLVCVPLYFVFLYFLCNFDFF